MDLIGVKIKNIKSLCENISEHIEKIRTLKINICANNSIDNFLEQKNKNVSILEKLIDEIRANDIQNLDFCEGVFHIWHLIESILDMVNITVSILDNKIKINTIELTSTKINTITNAYGNIEASYNSFNKKYIVIDKIILKKLNEMLNKSDSITKENAIHKVNAFTKHVKKYIYAVALYVILIQTIMDYSSKYGDIIRDQIINTIEEVKDFILVEKCKKPVHKSLYKYNPRLSTFGLVPTYESKSLSILTKDIFGKSIRKPSGLDSIAKSNKICILVLNSVVRHPIEFSMWKLNEWQYAKEFIQDEKRGLNKKIIDRFNTIKFNEETDQKWDFGSSIYGDINSQEFIVMEKLGDDIYRVLSIYTDNGEYSNGGRLKKKINRNKIAELINYVVNGNSCATRVGEYNKIQEEKIVKKMFLPIYHDIENINLTSQIIDSKFLRHSIYVRLTKEYLDIVKTKFKKGADINNIKDIGKIIHDENLADIFSSLIVEQYYIYTFKNKKNVSTFSNAEIFKTLLSQLRLLTRDFVRTIHDIFSNLDIDIKIFEDTPHNKNNAVQAIINDLICNTLEKIITNEANIYQSLIYKTSLLNLSLV
jgi:hypothetical protein